MYLTTLLKSLYHRLGSPPPPTYPIGPTFNLWHPISLFVLPCVTGFLYCYFVTSSWGRCDSPLSVCFICLFQLLLSVCLPLSLPSRVYPCVFLDPSAARLSVFPTLLCQAAGSPLIFKTKSHCRDKNSSCSRCALIYILLCLSLNAPAPHLFFHPHPHPPPHLVPNTYAWFCFLSGTLIVIPPSVSLHLPSHWTFYHSLFCHDCKKTKTKKNNFLVTT